MPAESLGQTLMHEHVFLLDREIEANYPGRWHEQPVLGSFE